MQPRTPLSPSLLQRVQGIPPLDSSRLFNMPAPFAWTPTTTLPPPPVFPEIGSTSTPFTGPTFSGEPDVSLLPQLGSHNLPGFNNSSTALSSLASQYCDHPVIFS
ncbi:unnamed protein product [Cuscuta epithymum]|uniref:Uncharacterized protein n=1 Tax=Cuscuta epithymum TaxID=186058 RepID=A0AAV0C1G5_9ASTE|nr:unnamed protein product [Cuscuta epithymum]CAH9055948.1 unnamed protein product [Cuscuta epithymum]